AYTTSLGVACACASERWCWHYCSSHWTLRRLAFCACRDRPGTANQGWHTWATGWTLLTRLLLLTCTNEKRVPHVTPVPAGERPVFDDLGVRHHLDVHVEEGNDLKVVKLVVADLAQLLVKRLGIRYLQQVFPHFVDRIVLKPVA